MKFSQRVDLLEVVLESEWWTNRADSVVVPPAARVSSVSTVASGLPHRIERFLGGHDHLEIGRQVKGFQPLGRSLDRDVDTDTSRRRG